MESPWTMGERLAAGVIALLVFAAMALQTTINNDGSPLVAFALLFRYFTIWSNFAAGAVMAWVALGKRIDTRILFALATALSFVALVYHALLAADHHPVGLDVWTNQAFHTAIPAAVVVWWLVVTRAKGFMWSALPFAMIFPVIYTVFGLINGELTGFYPYFFLDKSSLGWGEIAANMVGLSVLFAVLGALLMGLRSLIARLAKPAA